MVSLPVVEPELADVLREHRRNLMREQSPGLADRWMFPTPTGKLRSRGSLKRARLACLKAAGVTRLVVFDGRLGPGRSKLEHMARDGSIVTVDRALQMAAEEHPNGTLSFGPHFDEEDE